MEHELGFELDLYGPLLGLSYIFNGFRGKKIAKSDREFYNRL